MKIAWLIPIVLVFALTSCAGGDRTEVTAIDELELPLAELVKEAAPTSHATQMFVSGKADGMTKEYGYPFYQDLYDARIVLNDQERDGFMERLGEGIHAVIKADGLRITGSSRGEEHRGFLYHGNGKRGTLDLFTILDTEQGTRILILVSEQPYQG
jgi:hypothetical protein